MKQKRSEGRWTCSNRPACWRVGRPTGPSPRTSCPSPNTPHPTLFLRESPPLLGLPAPAIPRPCCPQPQRDAQRVLTTTMVACRPQPLRPFEPCSRTSVLFLPRHTTPSHPVPARVRHARPHARSQSILRHLTPHSLHLRSYRLTHTLPHLNPTGLPALAGHARSHPGRPPPPHPRAEEQPLAP